MESASSLAIALAVGVPVLCLAASPLLVLREGAASVGSNDHFGATINSGSRLDSRSAELAARNL
jgi:hypothetical protein